MTPSRIYVRPYFAELAATRTAPDDLVYVLADDQSEKETMMDDRKKALQELADLGQEMDAMTEDEGDRDVVIERLEADIEHLEAENQALRSALRTLLAFDEDDVHPDNREWRRAVQAAEKVLG